ncbi:hypothetical protein ACVWWN_000243 [Mycobacterium sp. URHB0021]
MLAGASRPRLPMKFAVYGVGAHAIEFDAIADSQDLFGPTYTVGF